MQSDRDVSMRSYCHVMRHCLALLLLCSSVFAIGERKGQSAFGKFCFLLGKTVTEIVVKFQKAYKEAAMSKT